METFLLILLATTSAIAPAAVWLRARVRLRQVREGEQAAVRLIRLCARELQDVGMNLHGHAGLYQQQGTPGLGLVAGRVMAVAEALAEHAPANPAPRSLREQEVALEQAIADAVTIASSTLHPGQRHWRLPDAARNTLLWADARALRHVLAHVLADAVRATGEQDWIDIALRPHAEGLAVVVQDEGAGLARPDAAPALQDSRGIGLRLTLARNLMQAHGGRLEVESAASVGSRVTLIFPASRLRAPAAPLAAVQVRALAA